MSGELSALQWLAEPVRITKDAIYFGDHKVPGCLAREGVTLKPGGGTDINVLTVTFLVGEVLTEDPTKEVDQ